jgi:hypothetical protein
MLSAMAAKSRTQAKREVPWRNGSDGLGAIRMIKNSVHLGVMAADGSVQESTIIFRPLSLKKEGGGGANSPNWLWQLSAPLRGLAIKGLRRPKEKSQCSDWGIVPATRKLDYGEAFKEIAPAKQNIAAQQSGDPAGHKKNRGVAI